MKTILVTGGGGFIGSILVQKLLSTKRYRVRIFDTFYFGKKHLVGLSGPVEIIEGDIRSMTKRHLDGVDAVIHLAAISNDPTADFAPGICFKVNTQATKKLALLAKKQGVDRFIFASSASIYHGSNDKQHLHREGDSVKPVTHYSLSKYQGEKHLWELQDQHFAVTIVRMATVGGYSPRMKFDLAVNTMVKTALSEGVIWVYGGSQYRPLIDIRDVTDAYLKILTAPKAKVAGELFNLSFDNFLISRLAEEIASKLVSLGKRVRVKKQIPKFEVKSYQISSEKIKKILSFQAKYSPIQTVLDVVKQIESRKLTDLDNPKFYNMAWMKPILEKQLKTHNKSV